MTEAPHIGLVGCGRWGRLILRDLLALGCRVSVASIGESSRRYALDQGAEGAVASIADLPRQIDGAVVAVRTVSHYEALLELLPRGIPVFCEKPLTCDVAEARAIAAQAADRVFVMDKWRYHPAIEKLAEIASEKRYGEVQSIDSHRLQWGTSHADVDVVWTIMPHELSIIRHVLGRVPALQAAMGEWRGRELAGLTALMADRVSATTRVSENYPAHHREVRVVCEQAVLLLDDPYSDHIKLFRLEGERRPGNLPHPEAVAVSTEFPLLRELRWFRDYLRGGPAPLSDAREALAVVELIQRMREMAEAKRDGLG